MKAYSKKKFNGIAGMSITVPAERDFRFDLEQTYRRAVMTDAELTPCQEGFRIDSQRFGYCGRIEVNEKGTLNVWKPNIDEDYQVPRSPKKTTYWLRILPERIPGKPQYSNPKIRDAVFDKISLVERVNSFY